MDTRTILKSEVAKSIIFEFFEIKKVLLEIKEKPGSENSTEFNSLMDAHRVLESQINEAYNPDLPGVLKKGLRADKLRNSSLELLIKNSIDFTAKDKKDLAQHVFNFLKEVMTKNSLHRRDDEFFNGYVVQKNNLISRWDIDSKEFINNMKSLDSEHKQDNFLIRSWLGNEINEYNMDAYNNSIFSKKSYLLCELVPSSCWYSNLRDLVKSADWKKIQEYTFSRSNHICEICSSKSENRSIDCHEVWGYQNIGNINVQILIRTIGLCDKCHLLGKHYGLAQVHGRGEEARAHQTLINDWPSKLNDTMINRTIDLFNERSEIEWHLDMYWIGEIFPEFIEKYHLTKTPEQRHDKNYKLRNG
jgi:hypothetical protein